MKCSQIRQRLSQYVDDELGPDEKNGFMAHVQGCPACREALEEIQSVHQLFAFAERFEAPGGFAARVMAHLAEAEETAFSRWWRLLTGRSIFVRTVEVTFALLILLIGIISGHLVIQDRTPGNQTTVQESFSLDLFQAMPPDSVESTYMRLAGIDHEK